MSDIRRMSLVESTVIAQDDHSDRRKRLQNRIFQMKVYGSDSLGKLRKSLKGESSNTVIIFGGGILPVPVRINHNRKNPTTGYDHRCQSVMSLIDIYISIHIYVVLILVLSFVLLYIFFYVFYFHIYAHVRFHFF